MSDTDMCYVASKPGAPGYCCAAVDNPEHAAATAKDVAKWIRRGLSVTRVTVQAARDGLGEYLQHKAARIKP